MVRELRFGIKWRGWSRCNSPAQSWQPLQVPRLGFLRMGPMSGNPILWFCRIAKGNHNHTRTTQTLRTGGYNVERATGNLRIPEQRLLQHQHPATKSTFPVLFVVLSCDPPSGALHGDSSNHSVATPACKGSGCGVNVPTTCAHHAFLESWERAHAVTSLNHLPFPGKRMGSGVNSKITQFASIRRKKR